MMSKYFAWLEGDETPHDFVFKIFSHGYSFYLGGVCICQLFKKTGGSRATWACVVQGRVYEGVPILVEGFSTRHDAVDYALKTHPRTRLRYNK